MSVTRSTRFVRAATITTVALALALGIGGQASAAPPLTTVKHAELHPAFEIYDCGDFMVQAEWDLSLTITEYRDNDGATTSVKGHISYAGTFSHPDNGRWVNDRGVHTFVDDLVAGQTRDAGGYRKVTAPGEGVLMLDVGLGVWAWDDPGSFLRLAGPKDELEGKTDALCAYLRG
ncbi:MAG TPA: hypothetical protein VFO05_09710 [Candidatus Limnocylindrales bacterium]|nr:hypothetical protein [Candidatus Limnocylindrales bacterium]